MQYHYCTLHWVWHEGFFCYQIASVCTQVSKVVGFFQPVTTNVLSRSQTCSKLTESFQIGGHTLSTIWMREWTVRCFFVVSAWGLLDIGIMARAAKLNKTKLVPLATFSYFTQRPCRLHKVGVKVMLVAFREKQKWSDTAHPICCWKGVGWYQCLTSQIKLLYIDFFFFNLFPKIRNLTHVLRLVSHTNFSLWYPPFWNSLATLSVHVKKYKTNCLCTSRSNLSFSPPCALHGPSEAAAAGGWHSAADTVYEEKAGPFPVSAGSRNNTSWRFEQTAALPKILFANRRLKSCARSQTAEGVWRTVTEAVLLPLLKGPQSFHLRQ